MQGKAQINVVFALQRHIQHRQPAVGGNAGQQRIQRGAVGSGGDKPQIVSMAALVIVADFTPRAHLCSNSCQPVWRNSQRCQRAGRYGIGGKHRANPRQHPGLLRRLQAVQ